MRVEFFHPVKILVVIGALAVGPLLGSCAQVNVPDARTVDIPAPVTAKKRDKAINEHPDSVIYLPLGDDILVPEVADDDPLPYELVGPFELRSETLAGALQLILADYDVGLAFETNAAMERHITVANLSGELGKVVKRVCSLANLYCAFEDGTLVVKETQTFTVTLPPIGGASASSSSSVSSSEGDSTGLSAVSSSSGGGDYLGSVSTGLAAILGTSPITDSATRTIIYTASQRTSQLAERYFQRLRANTAMIIYETYIWEVSLDAGNSAGIDWSQIDQVGNFTLGRFSMSTNIAGEINSDFTSPVSIGLPTTGAINPADFITFLSRFGAVKTISQPQITVLSGASAQMRVADTQNYVAEISTTFNDTQSSTSVSTDTVDSGFTLTIASSWDKATVYSNVSIEISDVISLDSYNVTGASAEGEGDENTTRIQLPQTTERELNTQIRTRPGDSVLIGGLVRERDNFDSDGPGFMEPVLPKSRTAQSQNLELVIMLRPRVVVYTNADDVRYMNYAQKKSAPVYTSVTEAVAQEAPVPVPVTPAASLYPDPAAATPAIKAETAPSTTLTPVAGAMLTSTTPPPPPEATIVSVPSEPVIEPTPEPAVVPQTVPSAPVSVERTQEPVYSSIRPPRLSETPSEPVAPRVSPVSSRAPAIEPAVRTSPAAVPVPATTVAAPSQEILSPAVPEVQTAPVSAAPTPIIAPAAVPAPAPAYPASGDGSYLSPYETYEYYDPRS